LLRLPVCISIVLLLVFTAAAQTKRPPIKPKAKKIIFAVLNDGRTLEPIAFVDKGELTPATGGDAEPKVLADFAKTYYKPKGIYKMVFGGVDAGTVTIKSSDAKTECSPHTAQISWQSAKAKLRGMVMALATDLPMNKNASGLRRLPSAAERPEIEAMVRAEFTKNGVAASALRNLRSHNLTALDVDNDKTAELVGTYWVETAPTTRVMLFFIAEKNGGKYAFGHSEFETVKQEDVMSGDIKNVDEGIYHELLLDIFDYDGDGTSEVFTYSQSFEGAGFSAYRRDSGKWTRVFEGANYHCAY
jgi:hypothetical protein